MSYYREGLRALQDKRAALKQFLLTPESDTQYEFELILAECAELRERKVQQRGEGAYNQKDARKSKLELWANLRRKFIRVERYLYEGAGGTESLEDDLMDLVNFAAMGLQLMRREGWK